MGGDFNIFVTRNSIFILLSFPRHWKPLEVVRPCMFDKCGETECYQRMVLYYIYIFLYIYIRYCPTIWLVCEWKFELRNGDLRFCIETIRKNSKFHLNKLTLCSVYSHYHNFEIFGQNLCLSIYLYLFRCEIFMKNICLTIFHYIGYQSFNTTNISTYRYITEVRDLQCHCCIKLAILMIVHFRTNDGLWFRHYRLWYNQLPPLIWFDLSHISRCIYV